MSFIIGFRFGSTIVGSICSIAIKEMHFKIKNVIIA